MRPQGKSKEENESLRYQQGKSPPQETSLLPCSVPDHTVHAEVIGKFLLNQLDFPNGCPSVLGYDLQVPVAAVFFLFFISNKSCLIGDSTQVSPTVSIPSYLYRRHL